MFNINPVLRQYAVVITVNLMNLCTGMDACWTSPMLVKLRDPMESPLSHFITEDEAGWIVSIGYIFSIFTLPCIGILVDFMGRKYSILVMCLPKVIAGVITIFATEVWMLLVARAINVSMNTATAMVTMIYSTEIASKEIRGSLGSIAMILYSLGGIIMLGIGPYISYFNLNILMTSITAVACSPLLFIPDTAYSLYKKGKPEDAKKVLIFFRGSESLAEEEIQKFFIIEPNQEKRFDNTEILKKKVYLKALTIAIVMSIGVHLNGFSFIWFYLQTILEFTDTSISPALCSLIISLIRFLATIYASAVSDKFGRRSIIISALFGVALGMIGLGIFFTLKEHGIIISGFLNYLPLMSIALIASCHSGGVASQYLVLITELLDNKIRAIGTSAGLVAASTTVSLMSRFTLPVLSALGFVATFFMFAVTCIMFILFIFFVIPETKQKTIAEIQRALGSLKEDGEKINCVTRL